MARPKLESPNYRLRHRGGYYHVIWWEDGRPRSISTGQKDERAAKVWLTQFAAGRATPEPPATPTIAVILGGYLAAKKETARAYDTLEVAAKPLQRHLGDLQPEHLTTERARFYHRRRQVEGHMVGPADKLRKKPTSDGTIIRELGVLRAALRWAKKEKWPIGELPYIEVLSQPPPLDRWLTRDEAERLLESATALHIQTFIALALHTAARSAALLELTWDRVDLVTGIINLGYGHRNKRRGVVPINDALHPYLETARQAATSLYVVEYGGKPVASVKKAFKAAARRANIPDVSPHTLRHTSVTWMVMAGVPMPMIARYAAMSLAMVEKRYGHHSPDWLRQAARALEGKTA
jgi:integrase